MTKGGVAGSLFRFQNDAKLQCREAALTRIPTTAVIRVSLLVSQLPFIFTNLINSRGAGGEGEQMTSHCFTSFFCLLVEVAHIQILPLLLLLL